MNTEIDKIIAERFNTAERRWQRFLRTIVTNHHYEFIHEMVRECCQKMPEIFFNTMFSDQKDELIECIWDITCKEIGTENTTYFSHKDIATVIGTIGDYPSVLIIMPKPHITPDAYYAVAVLLEKEEIKEDSKVAYITLERGLWTDDAEVALLCAWNGNTHINFEVVMGTDIKEFIAAVEDILANRLYEAVGEAGVEMWKAIHEQIRESIKNNPPKPYPEKVK